MSDFYFEAARRVRDSRLKPMERLVAFALLTYWSRQSPQPWPSLSELQRATGCARATVVAAIEGLRRAGAIQVQTRKANRGQPVNHYDISGLVRLPTSSGDELVQELNQFTSETSSGDELVQELTPTSSGAEPQLVQELNSKGSIKGSKNTPEVARARKRPWRRVPAEWEPSDQHRTLARSLGVSFERELATFRDHEFHQPKRDADAAFRNWLRRAGDGRAPKRGAPPVQRGLAPGKGPVLWTGDDDPIPAPRAAGA